MIDEPQAGGLIDKYWILNVIIIPLVVLGILIGSTYLILNAFDCPYVEDVSSCFPYNMPEWFALVPVLGIPLLLFALFWLRKYIPVGEVTTP